MSASVAPPLGIDLGTTYSCIGYWKDNKVQTIKVDNNPTMASCVAFTARGQSYGQKAKMDPYISDSEIVYDSKRMLGATFDDLATARRGDARSDIERWPFKIEHSRTSPQLPVVTVREAGQVKSYAPEEVSAMVLTRLKKAAELHFNMPVRDVVITVPAYFSDAQRQATKDAAAIAQLRVGKLVKEPVAAVLAFKCARAESHLDKEETVLAFDLGGGTLDLSLIESKARHLKVLRTGGNMHLGGQDFDQRIVDWLVAEVVAEGMMPPPGSQDQQTLMRRLRQEAEILKNELAFEQEVQVCLVALSGDRHLKRTLSRSVFESMCKDLFEKCMDQIDELLSDPDKPSGDWPPPLKAKVDRVLLVGGATRMHKIRRMLTDYFEKEPDTDIDADEAVMHGAAIVAARLGPVSPRGLGGEVMVTDVAPMSIGIHVVGGRTEKLIQRNVRIPVTLSKDFTTVEDDQDRVIFKVYQGEDDWSVNNILVGEFVIDGIQRAKAGVAKFVVKMKIDADSLLQVTGTEKNTGKMELLDLKVTRHGVLSVKEVQAKVNNQKPPPFIPAYRPDFVPPGKAPKSARDQARVAINQQMKDMEQCIQNPQVPWDLRTEVEAVLDETRSWMSANPRADVAELDIKLRQLKTY